MSEFAMSQLMITEISFQHEDFNLIPADGDDICVMHLTETIDFSQGNVAVIQLANDGDDFSGLDNCFITGWGQTSKKL